MSGADRSVRLDCPPEEALQLSALALIRAGFRRVDVNDGVGLITAEKRAFGQWTKASVILTVRASDGGSTVTATSGARAQSLSSLVSDPAQRLVDSALDAVEAG
jgi:hypothetical protein